MFTKFKRNRFRLSLLSVLAFLLLVPQQAISADECFVKYSKTDICAYAAKIQEETAPSLPMQISENLIWRSIVAVGPMLHANVTLKYDEKFLNSALEKQGVPRAIVDMKMREMTHNMVCSDEILPAFLDLGGYISYRYNFNDGKKYLEISLSPKTC